MAEEAVEKGRELFEGMIRLLIFLFLVIGASMALGYALTYISMPKK